MSNRPLEDIREAGVAWCTEAEFEALFKRLAAAEEALRKIVPALHSIKKRADVGRSDIFSDEVFRQIWLLADAARTPSPTPRHLVIDDSKSYPAVMRKALAALMSPEEPSTPEPTPAKASTCSVCGEPVKHPICAVHRYGNHKSPVMEEPPAPEVETCRNCSRPVTAHAPACRAWPGEQYCYDCDGADRQRCPDHPEGK